MASWTSRGSLSDVGNDLLQDTTGAQPIVIARNSAAPYVIFQKEFFFLPALIQYQTHSFPVRYLFVSRSENFLAPRFI